MKTTHTWRFFRAGGFDQVTLDTGADLANLDQLDEKLWVALACPIAGLEFDARTLALVDSDKDGRIRAPELIAAAKWLTANLKNPNDAFKRAASLPLAAINDATPEGARLLASARQILTNLGRPAVTEITVEDTADTAKVFAQTQFNGDGIIPVDAAEDDSTRAVITDIITCRGSDADRSGKPGIDQARVDDFFTQAAAFAEWWSTAESDPKILPVGGATAAAAAAVAAVKGKVDDYFARCRLAAFDARAAAPMNRDEKDYAALALKDLALNSPEIAAFPLAHIEAGKPLPLTGGINPAWAAAVATLQAAAIQPLLGPRTVLTESDWNDLLARLQPYDAWVAAKAGGAVEPLGIKRVREILAGKAKETITALIAKDKALEPEATAITEVDRLIHYHRDLAVLCVNFVNFAQFYRQGGPAIFQAGTLYLDQRSCEFTLPVADAARHAALAGLAGAYLAYCDCVRKGTGEQRQIVAAFTDGDSENLMVGRNGIFYDRQGRDWDATITKVIENPISLCEAFWLPYKKFVRFIEGQVAKRATAADTASTAKLETAASTVATADKTPPPPQKKVDVGTVAALGVAFGAIGGFLVALWSNVIGLFHMGTLAIVGAIAGVILLISGPSLILAFIKLRKRNLGPILDANGWAVNARAKINVPFGRALTKVAKLPPGSRHELADPFASKKNPWVVFGVVLLALWLIWKILVATGAVGLVVDHLDHAPAAASTNSVPATAPVEK